MLVKNSVSLGNSVLEIICQKRGWMNSNKNIFYSERFLLPLDIGLNLPALLMKKDLRPSWKQLVNIKNKIVRVNILLSQIYIQLQIHRSGNETHLMINTTKNIIKSKLEYIMIPSDFYFFFRTFRFSIQN